MDHILLHWNVDCYPRGKDLQLFEMGPSTRGDVVHFEQRPQKTTTLQISLKSGRKT